MPTQFIKQATQQIAPAYKQQNQALQAQIPAIQQLYNSLFQGLQAQGQQETQNIYEGASGRGLLYSSIPVDAQTGLQQALIQKRGELGAQQAQEVAGVQQDLGALKVDRANAISQLAQALAQSSLQRRQFQFTKQQSNRQFSFDRRLANRQYQLDKQALYY